MWLSASLEASWSESNVPGVVSESEYPTTVAVSDVHMELGLVTALPDALISLIKRLLKLSNPLRSLFKHARVNKHDLLRGGRSDSGISSLRSIGGGMYRDGGSGGHGGDDDGSNGDGTGGGDECVDGAMHLARRSPAEGGDSEIGGDGGGVGMARSLSTSTSGGRDMEA
ncbi:hypothetical protein Tco_0383018 [Tanacetum coccineum]